MIIDGLLQLKCLAVRKKGAAGGWIEKGRNDSANRGGTNDDDVNETSKLTRHMDGKVKVVAGIIRNTTEKKLTVASRKMKSSHSKKIK